jgi:hypothetical protein
MLTPILVSLLAIAPCAPERPTAEGVRYAEAAWAKAIETRDAPKLACRLAPEFVDSDWQGRMRARADVLAALGSHPQVHLALSELTIRLIRNVAIARGLNSERSADGHFVGQVRFTDVFVYEKGIWRAISAQETLARNGRRQP